MVELSDARRDARTRRQGAPLRAARPETLEPQSRTRSRSRLEQEMVPPRLRRLTNHPR